MHARYYVLFDYLLGTLNSGLQYLYQVLTIFLLQALTLMDMSATNPKATFSVSADVKLIDATGRPFSISIDYAGSLEVGPHDVKYTDRLKALTCSPSN